MPINDKERPDSLGDNYERLAAALWDYLEGELPGRPEVRGEVHADTLREMDRLLAGFGVEVT